MKLKIAIAGLCTSSMLLAGCAGSVAEPAPPNPDNVKRDAAGASQLASTFGTWVGQPGMDALSFYFVDAFGPSVFGMLGMGQDQQAALLSQISAQLAETNRLLSSIDQKLDAVNSGLQQINCTMSDTSEQRAEIGQMWTDYSAFLATSKTVGKKAGGSKAGPGQGLAKQMDQWTQNALSRLGKIGDSFGSKVYSGQGDQSGALVACLSTKSTIRIPVKWPGFANTLASRLPRSARLGLR